MSRKISDFLLVSDMDKTLITEHYKIPERNLIAIKRFREKGGHFSIATGRSIASAQAYVEMLGLDIPIIVCNGAVIYDYAAKKVLFEKCMPIEAEQVAYELLEKFPMVGGEAFIGEEVYVLQTNDYIDSHAIAEKLAFKDATQKNAPHNWSKAIFADKPEIVGRMEDYAKTIAHHGLVFVKSAPEYFELMPEGVNKGTGLLHLAALLGVKQENTAAVGDYYNDVEMIQVAGIGAFADNAPQELKDIADIVVCDYTQGAVADIIEYLERICEKA